LVAGGYLGATTVQAASAGTIFNPFSLFGAVANGQGTPVTTPTDLYIVLAPEPATITLTVLAAGALLISRRRK
jgi:hypothetical protein